jgi:aspartate racemase
MLSPLVVCRSCVRDPAEREEINRIIMRELVYGDFNPEAVNSHQRVIARMKERGCDAVLLGCTEIPLIMNNQNSPLPTLNSLTRHNCLRERHSVER